MRLSTWVVLALLLSVAPRARAQGTAGSEATQLGQLRQELEALKRYPAERAQAREIRGRGEELIANQARAVEYTIALGQSDVGDSLRELRTALEPYEEAALGDANQVEAAHVRRAMDALAEAESRLGSEDLFRSRDSIDLALFELERARDQALSD